MENVDKTFLSPQKFRLNLCKRFEEDIILKHKSLILGKWKCETYTVDLELLLCYTKYIKIQAH